MSNVEAGVIFPLPWIKWREKKKKLVENIPSILSLGEGEKQIMKRKKAMLQELLAVSADKALPFHTWDQDLNPP